MPPCWWWLSYAALDGGAGGAASHRLFSNEEQRGPRVLGLLHQALPGRQVRAAQAPVLVPVRDRLGQPPMEPNIAPALIHPRAKPPPVVAEVHDTHHPISVSRTYEEQRSAAHQRAVPFRKERLPKYLGYFECALGHREHLIGDQLSYVHLSLFQVLFGLTYAFPR